MCAYNTYIIRSYCIYMHLYVHTCVSMQKEESDKLRANLQYTKEEAYGTAIKYVCTSVHACILTYTCVYTQTV